MAVTRDKLFNGILNGAAWDAGVVFNRTNGLPIDKFSVFESYESASDYAANNPVSYPGQLIAVVPEVGDVVGYIISVTGQLKAIGAGGAAGQVDSTSVIHINEDGTHILSNLLETYMLNIDYGSLVAFDTTEIVMVNNDQVATLGLATLGQMMLGQG